MLPEESNPSTNEIGIPPYLIIKNRRNDDYKFNFFYFFSQFYKFRWLLCSIIAVTTITSLYFTKSLVPQYKVTSMIELLPQEFNNIYNLIDPFAPQNSSSQTFKLKWSNNGKSLDLQYNNESKQKKQPFEKIINAISLGTLQNPSNIKAFLQQSGLFERELEKSADHSQDFKIKLMTNLINSYEFHVYPNKRIEFDTLSANPELAIKEHASYLDYTNNKILSALVLNKKLETERKIMILKEEIKNSNGNQNPTNVTNSNNKSSVTFDKLAELKRLESLTFDTSDISIFKTDGPPYINALSLSKKKRMWVFIGFSIGLLISMLFILLRSNLIEHYKPLRRVQN